MNKPLEYLRHSPEWWEALTTGETVILCTEHDPGQAYHQTNRMRAAVFSAEIARRAEQNFVAENLGLPATPGYQPGKGRVVAKKYVGCDECRSTGTLEGGPCPYCEDTGAKDVIV
jgi:hypothetical protein